MTMYIIIDFINFTVRALSTMIIVHALLSWFVRDPANPIMRVLNGVLNPLINPIRKIVPSIGGIDISPLILLLLLNVFNRVMTTILLDISY